MSGKNIQQAKQKAELIEQLKKVPIVQIAAERAGVSRASYYVWRKQDPEFAKNCDAALSDGFLLVNDLAESQLIAAIKNQDFSAIRFWLSNHHPIYAAKLQINASIDSGDEILSPEQSKFINQAIKLLDGADDNQAGQKTNE